MEDARDLHLLLVAARELDDALVGAGASDPELVDPVARRGARALREAIARAPQLREREVLRDGERDGQPLPLAVLAHEADALGEPLHGRGRACDGAHTDLPAT